MSDIRNKQNVSNVEPKYDLTSGKTISQILGEIAWMLSQSSELNNLQMADLEWLVMPPILLKQFQIQYADQTPVALELFALVDERSVPSFVEGARSLAAKDWASGSHRLTVLRLNLITKEAELFASMPTGSSSRN